jgi:Ni/Fe-hydrogenase 1 B-type cytochrome subunit
VATTIANAAQNEKRIVRYYVWELPVRLVHWTIVFTIVILSVTGYYIQDPYLIAHGSGAYVMGTMRAIHLGAGFVFLAALVFRLYWFFAGNEFARWRAFLPLTKKQRLNLWETIRYYGLRRYPPPLTIGHNMLAAPVYALIYLLCGVEAITGLAMYNAQVQNHFLGFFIGWISYLVSIQTLRSIHYFLMFAFWAFLVHHLYSAVLTAIHERDGLMDSIFTGNKSVSSDLLEPTSLDLLDGELGEDASRR